MYFLYAVFWLFVVIYLFQWMGAWGDVLLWGSLIYALCTLLPWYLARRPGCSQEWSARIRRWISMPVILLFYVGVMLTLSGGWMLAQGYDFIGQFVFLAGLAAVVFAFLEWRKLRT